MGRIKHDKTLIVKDNGETVLSLGLVRIPFTKRFIPYRNGKPSNKVESITITQATDEVRKWLVK